MIQGQKKSNIKYIELSELSHYKSIHTKNKLDFESKKAISYKTQKVLKLNLTNTIFQFIFNLGAVCLFIVQSYGGRNINLDTFYFTTMKLVLTVYFILEIFYFFKSTIYKSSQLFHYQFILDVLTAIFLSCDIYFDIIRNRNQKWDKTMWMFLSLKFLKVQKLAFLLIFKSTIPINCDKDPKLLKLSQQIRMEIVRTFLKIITLIVINTALVLFIDFLHNYNLFQNHKGNYILDLRFHDALYFQLITMTTIGYGDITPGNPQGRIIMILFILVIVLMFTQFLGNMIDLLKQFQGYKNFLKKSQNTQIIIIGNILNSQKTIKRFLTNYYNTKYFDKKLNKFRFQIVYVSTQPPVNEINSYLQQENLKMIYGTKKIKFIQVENFDSDLKWIKQVRFEQAHGIIYYNSNDDQQQAVINERNVTFMLGIISNKYQHLQLYLYISTSISIKETKLLKVQNHIEKRKLLNCLLGKTTENLQICQFFQKILFMNQNQQNLTFDRQLLHSKQALNNQKSFVDILTTELPFCLIGESFINLVKIFYFQYNILIIGIKTKESTAQEDISKIIRKKNEILIHPTYYRVRKLDKGIFISNVNFEQIQKIMKEFTKQTKDNFLNNFEFPHCKIDESVNLIGNLFIENNYEKNLKLINYKNLNFYTNLYKQSQERIINIQDHTIFFGCQSEDIFEIKESIHSTTPKRQIVFVFEKDISIISLENVNIIVMSLSNEKHISYLNLSQAYRIVIRIRNEVKNMESLSLFKFYRQIYKEKNVFFSLYDENMLDFFSQRPIQQNINKQYYPLFIQGKVLLEENFFNSISVLDFYQKGICSFFLNLIQSNQTQQIQMFELELDQKITNSIKTYGDLQYFFTCLQNPCTLLGIYKREYQDEDKFSNEELKIIFQNEKQNINIEQEQLVIDGEYVDLSQYVNQYLIVNPSPYETKIKEGDKVLVIGNKNQADLYKSNVLEEQKEIEIGEKNFFFKNDFNFNDENKLQSLKKFGTQTIQKHIKLTKNAAQILKSYKEILLQGLD